MKKLLAILLVVAMVGLISLPVMAAQMTDAELETVIAGDDEGSEVKIENNTIEDKIKLEVKGDYQKKASVMYQNAVAVNSNGCNIQHIVIPSSSSHSSE